LRVGIYFSQALATVFYACIMVFYHFPGAGSRRAMTAVRADADAPQARRAEAERRCVSGFASRKPCRSLIQRISLKTWSTSTQRRIQQAPQFPNKCVDYDTL
jgi:hypothetical protein